MLVCRWKISYSNVIERRKVAIDNDESCRTIVYFSVSHIKMGNGDTTPDLDNLIRLAEIFDVSLDEHVLANTNEVKVERIYEKNLDL